MRKKYPLEKVVGLSFFRPVQPAATTCQPKELTIFPLNLPLCLPTRPVRTYVVLAAAGRHTGFSSGRRCWLTGVSSRYIHGNSTCTSANLKADGQQMGLEKYKFYNDPLHLVKWKFTYINMKYMLCCYSKISTIYTAIQKTSQITNLTTKWDLFGLAFHG